MNTKWTRTLGFLLAALALGACGDDDGGSCNNGVLEAGEVCETINNVATFPKDMNTCEAQTGGQMKGGTVSCKADCTADISKCSGDTSGNGGTGG